MAKIRFARYAVSAGVVGLVGALVAAGSGAGAASAVADAAVSGDQTGAVKTTVEKVVNQTANASGAITGNTMITQVSAVGNGTMNVQVPIGTSSLRDLDSFSGIATQGDAAVFNQSVNGSSEQRIMSKSNLAPIKVEVSATLDGKSIKPEDVINKTGVLDVKYKIINTTRSDGPITFQDGSGNTVTQNLQTAVPFTGGMEVTLPQGFNEISAPGTTGVAGDGHNGTLLDYTMTLFPPLGAQVPLAGASEITIGYQSRITNGTLPEAQFSFTPVVPYSDSTIAQTKNAMSEESADGAKLVAAGSQMGASLSSLTAPTGVPHLISEMSSGIQTANKDLQKLTGPVVGTDAIVSAKAVAAGAQKVQSELAAAMPELQELGGIEDLLTGLLAAYEPQLKPMLDKLGKETVTLPIIGTSTIEDLIPTVGFILNGDVGAMQSVTGAISTDITAMGSCASCASDIAKLTAANNQWISTIVPWSTLAALPNPYGGWTWPAVEALLMDLIAVAVPQLLSLPVAQDLFDDAPALQKSVAAFLDATGPLVDQAQATVDSLYPAVDDMKSLRAGLTESLANSQQISGDANSLVAAGPDALTAIGQQVTDENAPVLAQLDAIQKIGVDGTGIPYGPAKGANVSTTANYNLVVAGAGTVAKDNTINWVLGILFLIVAVGIGTAVWNRRRSA